MSHQHLISTKVDIFVMQQDQGVKGSADGEWVKLGHFVFENNEESGFAARELKTVKIDRKMTRKLKLAFSRGYVNVHNIYNQVGIVSINLIGWAEDMAHQPAEGGERHRPGRGAGDGRALSERVPRGNGGALGLRNTVGMDEMVENYGVMESTNKGSFNAGSAELVSLALEAGIDPFLMHIIRDAHKHKHKAVMKEDYEEARRLRDGIERLKLIGMRVAELEGKKQKAVEHEDYESAHILKKDIDKLRQSCVSLGIGNMQAAAHHQQQMGREKLQDASYKPKIMASQPIQFQTQANAKPKLASLGRKKQPQAAQSSKVPNQKPEKDPVSKALFTQPEPKKEAEEGDGGGDKTEAADATKAPSLEVQTEPKKEEAEKPEESATAEEDQERKTVATSPMKAPAKEKKKEEETT